MGGNNLKWFIIVSSFAGIVVSLNVSCTDVNQQPLTCRCQTTNNVEWYKNGTKISGCTPTLCFPSPPSGYELTPSANLYTIEIAVFDDSFCSSYSCKDVVNQASEPFPVCVDSTTTSTSSSTITTNNSSSTNTQDPTTSTTTIATDCGECEYKFDGTKIAFTVIDYVLDAVYTLVVVWLTLECCAKIWKPEGCHKDAILAISTVAVVLLDIGLTILLFVNDDSQDCKPECKEECNCSTHTLRLALTVVAWLLDCGGYVMIIYYIFNREVEPKSDYPLDEKETRTES